MKRLLIILLTILAFASCNKDGNFSYSRQSPSGTAETWAEKTRVESDVTRNVMLLYSAGFNSLCDYLDTNIKELEEGFIPDNSTMGDHILLVYSKLTTRNKYGKTVKDYSVPTKSALFMMYRKGGSIIKDTLMVYGENVMASDPATFRKVCQTMYNLFHAKSYGVVFTSHASGWLPPGYYNDPNEFEPPVPLWTSSVSKKKIHATSFYPPLDSTIPVKSFGQDAVPGASLEMDMDAFAEAIPFHLKYLLIDACLSGCVEVAWQLRDKADIVGFSQAEILAEGFDYTTLASRLLVSEPDPVQVCKDYFHRYDIRSGQSRSATISVVDTREMDQLAQVCRTLFEKYRSQIDSLKGNKVQGYFRYERHFFYDLLDILVKAGITNEEKAQVQDALDRCVLYKAATDSFLGDFTIKTACGFSMYLPSMGSDFLDNYYRNHVSWNEATLLVE